MTRFTFFPHTEALSNVYHGFDAGRCDPHLCTTWGFVHNREKCMN
jgi:hypothetical protein